MNLKDITVAANDFTDESFTSLKVKSYVNEAISKINIQLKAKLPLINDDTSEYVALSPSWVMSLLVPYACYSIKMNDGSLNEADRFKDTFETNLKSIFENRYDAISETYRTTNFDSIYKIDTAQGVNVGWFKKYSDDEGF